MASFFDIPSLSTLLVGAFILGGARWAYKVDRSINETLQAATLLRQSLQAHEKLNDVQFDAVDRRLDLVERREA